MCWQAPRRWLPLLAFTVVAAGMAAVLIHSALRKPPGPPRDMAELLERVRPLGLHVVTANKNCNPTQGVYLCVAPRPHDELNALPYEPESVGRWSGVVFVTHSAASWENAGERVGPFVLFGDPALVRRVLEALADGGRQ